MPLYIRSHYFDEKCSTALNIFVKFTQSRVNSYAIIITLQMCVNDDGEEITIELIIMCCKLYLHMIYLP